METEIDLEHIRSLKEFSNTQKQIYGRSAACILTEDPDIFMTNILTREGLASYIIVVGEKYFAFGIDSEFGASLKTYEADNLMNIWVDYILCDVIDYSSDAVAYINFATESSFSSAEERDVIVDLFGKCVVEMGKPDPTSRAVIWPKRLMFTEHAKKQLAACVRTGN